jgi:sterol desaturase/sphingolipid hydroxylase (fatty acid hydroxylase superfamily)
MHRWFYCIHRYHHQFNDYVVPVSGIAVSHAEFLLAYACPVIVGLCLGRPSKWTLAIFLALEYTATTVVHCGFIKSEQDKFIVTPAYHIAHHGRCPNKNLSAPMFTLPDLWFGTQMDNKTAD